MLQHAALCASGALTGAACNTATDQSNTNTGSNTAGQTAGGGLELVQQVARTLQIKE